MVKKVWVLPGPFLKPNYLNHQMTNSRSEYSHQMSSRLIVIKLMLQILLLYYFRVNYNQKFNYFCIDNFKILKN
jgi:hypothetical protein